MILLLCGPWDGVKKQPPLMEYSAGSSVESGWEGYFSSRLVLQAENILSTIRSHLGSSGIESALERIGIGSVVLGIRAIVLIDRE